MRWLAPPTPGSHTSKHVRPGHPPTLALSLAPPPRCLPQTGLALNIDMAATAVLEAAELVDYM